MIKVKDLSQEFQEIYIKYKQSKQNRVAIKKSTFDRACEFLLEKNKKLIGKMKAEDSILINHSKPQKKGAISPISMLNSKLEKSFKQNEASRFKKAIQEMISTDNLKIPDEFSQSQRHIKSPILKNHPNQTKVFGRADLTKKEVFSNNTTIQTSKTNLHKIKKKEKRKNNELSSTMKENLSIINDQSIVETKLVENRTVSNMTLDLSTRKAIEELNSLKKMKDYQKRELLKKKDYLLFQQKRDSSTMLENYNYLTNNLSKSGLKPIDVDIDNDLVYYSAIGNDYTKARLMLQSKKLARPSFRGSLQVNSPSSFKNLRNSGPRNLKKSLNNNAVMHQNNTGNIDKNILESYNHYLQSTSSQAVSTQNLKQVDSETISGTGKCATDLIDNCYNSSRDLKKKMMKSLQAFNTTRNELAYKVKFFRSNF